MCLCVCGLKKILSFASFWWVSSTLSFRRTSCNLSCCEHPAAPTQQNKHLERFQPNTWISKKELNIPHLLRHEASQKHFPRRLLQKIGPSHVPNSIQFIKIPSLDWWLPRICRVFRMMYPSRRSFQYHVFFTSLLHRH